MIKPYVKYDNNQRIETFGFDQNDFNLKDIIDLTKRYLHYDWARRVNVRVENIGTECKLLFDWSQQLSKDRYTTVIPDFLEIDRYGFIFINSFNWEIPDEYKELIDVCPHLKEFSKDYNITDSYNVKYKIDIESLSHVLNRYNSSTKIIDKKFNFPDNFKSLIGFSLLCRDFYNGIPKRLPKLEIPSYFDTSYVKYGFEIFTIKEFLNDEKNLFKLKLNKYSHQFNILGIDVVHNLNLRYFYNNKDILYLLNIAKEDGKSY